METVVDLTLRNELEAQIFDIPSHVPTEPIDDVSIIDDPADQAAKQQQTSASSSAPETSTYSNLKRKREEGEESEGNDTCMICFEQWTNTGEHRVVCLGCGHLFGASCIQKWLSERKHCPTCNHAAKRRDIRTVYACNLVAVDTAEKDRALQELSQERKLRVQAQERQKRLQDELMKLAVSRDELLQEISRLKRRLHDPKPTTDLQIEIGHWRRVWTVRGIFGGARVMDFSEAQSCILVSCSLPQAFMGNEEYSLCKINIVSKSHQFMGKLHTKHIRDCKVEPHMGTQVLTCSVDKTVRITNIENNTLVHSYAVSDALWSCCWHPKNRNLFFCGGAQNRVYLFDTRITSKPCRIIAGIYPQPTHSLCMMGTSLIGGTTGGCCCWTFMSEDLSDTQSQVSCSAIQLEATQCTSVSCDASLKMCLASFRNSESAGSKPCHVTFRLNEESGGIQPEETLRLVGHAGSQFLSRSSFIKTSSDGSDGFSVASGDETSKSLWIWETKEGSVKDKLPPHSSPVLDVKNVGSFLFSLSDSEIILFEEKEL